MNFSYKVHAAKNLKSSVTEKFKTGLKSENNIGSRQKAVGILKTKKVPLRFSM